MPNQETMHPEAKVKAYPVAERHRFIWVWIGDPALANEDDIPALPWCSSNDWTFDGGTYQVKCDYQLLVDNLMDLSHETYVHESSIGQPEINEVAPDVTADSESVTVTRWMLDITPPPFWQHNFKTEAQCDRWQSCVFTLPANITIDVGVALAGTGAPEGDRSQGISARVINLMTPETETTCHYHWGFARDFEIHDQGLTQRIREAQGGVFMEDVEVLEEQQRNILARPDRKLVSFNIDAGGVRARKLMERVLKEQAKLAAE